MQWIPAWHWSNGCTLIAKGKAKASHYDCGQENQSNNQNSMIHRDLWYYLIDNDMP